MASWLKNFFRKKEYLISIDIGASGLKLLELDLSTDPPTLLNVGFQPVTGEIFSNNAITKPDKIAEQIAALLESNSVSDKRAVTAVPGPSVFTKKIKMQKMAPEELAANVQYEASNFIPHNIDAVRIDYHILGQSGKSQLDVLVVAVKNEIIDSFLSTLSLAGLETAVVDVDHFAVQNMFEMCYPEDLSKTVALINMGSRFAGINIVKSGNSLFTGDIPVGGKLFTDALVAELGVTAEVADKLKRSGGEDPQYPQAKEIVDKNVEYVASEFNRQLSFFWNASGAEDGIDKIVLCGGGALIPGLLQEIAEKTGIECVLADPFKAFSVGSSFDPKYLSELRPLMAVCAGMAMRQPGDRILVQE